MKKKNFLYSILALPLFGINTIVKADGYIVDNAPDSFIANLLYFLGFIILVAGIGIIYINVKAKKKQYQY